MDKKTDEGARARLEAMQRDLETKVAALRAQAASASGERKQELEKQLAEVQADYKERTAKLNEALEETWEMLGRLGPSGGQATDGEVTQGGRPIERVYEGMTVVDSEGKKVGKVTMVRIGDPEALTNQGQYRDERPFIEFVALEQEPDVPDALRPGLIRLGYIKVERSRPLGIGEKDHYVRSDRIADVSGDRVTLTVPEAQLLDEEE